MNRKRSGEHRTGRVTRYNAQGDILPNVRKLKQPRAPHVVKSFRTGIDPALRVKPAGFSGIPLKDPVAKKPKLPRVPKLGTAPAPGLGGKYIDRNFDVHLQNGDEFTAVITKLLSGVPIRILNKALKAAVKKAVEAGQLAVKGGTGRAAMSILGEVQGGMAQIYSDMPDRVVSTIDRGVAPGAGMRHGPYPGPLLPGLIAWKDAVGYTGWAIQLAERIKMTGTKPKRFIYAMGKTLQETINSDLTVSFDKEVEVWWYTQAKDESPDLTGTGFETV